MDSAGRQHPRRRIIFPSSPIEPKERPDDGPPLFPEIDRGHWRDGVGYVDVLHFASCTPNIGEFQEYKGGLSKSGRWYDPPLKLTDGAISVPTGPGLGLPTDADAFRGARELGNG
jgi:hypothetical protein